ncbi:sigma-70 family RNA polymerase sigma factor [Desertifilum tharense]|uniref:Sigma-70 family RNA polymerase sigma factor n=2 Tax=Desertifilum tharense IPPAS B-1220 TaxID=1781255 RepID=A0ACD5H0Q3_9CYAN|nr:sigma-70 family RNA polymerase sigma factor [Desertifilum tharense]
MARSCSSVGCRYDSTGLDEIQVVMHPRASLIDIFSTFLQFDADRLKGWVSDSQLRRSMQKCLEGSDKRETSANQFWVLYWYKIWESRLDRLARSHLVAYLQETGYWTAHKIVLSFHSSQYALSDYFQIAIAQVDKVLKGYNPQQGVRLNNYASAIFHSAIKETLRQRHEVDICTPWALLRKLSQKRLEEALAVSGLPAETIASYILAWSCFKAIYVPTQASGTRQLDTPDGETWKAIATCYNEHRQNLPPCQAADLEKWLLACVKAARAYLYPVRHSLNSTKPEQESEWVDELVAFEGESLLSQLIAQQEEQSRLLHHSQINQILTDAMAQLAPESQELLQLYYAQGLTQQQLAQKLEIKQYTVSRRLTKIRSTLLSTLAQWSAESLHISLTSEVLKSMSVVLDEWLNTHFQREE